MDDRTIMENMLQLEKGACDLFMHGSIESATQNVHKTFCSALDESLRMQDNIYLKMQAKGWYPAEQAEQQKLDSVKQKFSAQA